MLTQNHILRCYEEGVMLYLRRKHVPQVCFPSECLQKGYFEGSEAVVILPHLESFDDLAVTIIHELIHARDEFLSYYSRKREGLADDRLENLVDDEAILTYGSNPRILQFIGELYEFDLSDLALPPKSVLIRTAS